MGEMVLRAPFFRLSILFKNGLIPCVKELPCFNSKTGFAYAFCIYRARLF